MNDLLELLEGGDLRSDGAADEVAAEVEENPELFDLLFDGLNEKDDLIRGRTAHTLEKVSRLHPELFREYTDKLIESAKNDHLPFVLWHLAMLFANLDYPATKKKEVISTLFYLLDDKSTFVKTWSISSLTILAMESNGEKELIIAKIKKFKENESAVVRNRVGKALNVLENDEKIPKGWSKIER